MFENQGGLPRQCEHWLAMTRFFDSLKRAAIGRPFSIIRENYNFIEPFPQVPLPEDTEGT